MNFINHSKPGSLDSGDSIDCIQTGLTVARDLLTALNADMSVSDGSIAAFGDQAEALEEWHQAAKALLDVTEPDRTLILTVDVTNMTESDLGQLQAALSAQLEDTTAGESTIEIS